MADAPRILVADDSSAVREIMRQILTRAGAEVVTCRTRDDLDAAALWGRFDAVIADVTIHGHRVDDLLLRLSQRFPCLPIMIVTASNRIDPNLDGPVTGWFFKPFPDLVEVARYTLGFARSYAQRTAPDEPVGEPVLQGTF